MSQFFKNLQNLPSSHSPFKTLSLLFLIAVFISIPLTVWLVVMGNLHLYGQAIETAPSSILLESTPTPVPQDNFNVRVLYVALNPVEGKTTLADEFFSQYFPGQTVAEFEDHLAQDTSQAFQRISHETINYQIVRKIHLTEFPQYTNGYEYDFAKYEPCVQGDPFGDCERQKFFFDHHAWIADNQICEIAAQENIDEIWLITAPFITTYESFMIGPQHSFAVNGPGFIMPQCSKHYVVMNVNYDRPENFLHNHGHRLESMMSYLTQYWLPEDQQNYWLKFSFPPFLPTETPYCGNTHFPPNADSAYDYDNYTSQETICPDWPHFPDFTGQTENINCTAWNCHDWGWQEYWFSSLPQNPGEVEMESVTGKTFFFKKNWWFYLLSPENCIAFNLSLSITPTPTPVPSSSPTPTAAPSPLPTPTSFPGHLPLIITRSLPEGQVGSPYFALIIALDQDSDFAALEVENLPPSIKSYCLDKDLYGFCLLYGRPLQAGESLVQAIAFDDTGKTFGRSYPLIIH